MDNYTSIKWTKKINKFLEMYNLTRLNQEETENTNRLITSNKLNQ